MDPSWREIVFVQISVFMVHLLSYAAQSDAKPPSAKSLSISLLNADQEKWIHDFNRTLMAQILKYGEDSTLYSTVKWILREEKNWMAWKAVSCPSFEKDQSGEFLLSKEAQDILYDTKKIMDMIDLGSDELSRLWQDKANNLEATSRPKLLELLSPLYEQMDPDSGIEEEYWLSREVVHYHDGIFLHILDISVARYSFSNLPSLS